MKEIKRGCNLKYFIVLGLSIVILYILYTYKKVEKYDDPVATDNPVATDYPILSGVNSLKTIILNGYESPVNPSIDVADEEILCDKSDPERSRCLRQIIIDHPRVVVPL
jgi:hypothetical protein